MMTIVALVLGLRVQLLSQEQSVGQITERIAILPLRANGIDSVSLQTAESILRSEIGKMSRMDIISARRTEEALDGKACPDAECALAIGKTLGASEVLGCKLLALGEKIIVQYFLVDVSLGKEVLIDQATAFRVEDLEVVMKRIAGSVAKGVSLADNAEVGNIIPAETREPQRRASRRNVGVGFGYLYPQNEYDGADRIFVADLRVDYELEDYAVGMLLGIRKGFATDLYGSYLFSRKDICPYLGGGVGFHWVSHSASIFQSSSSRLRDLRGDGFEVSGNAGIRLLHTYDFQLIFNVEYIYTFNDYNDQAIVFTIGIL